jgi:5'-3' exonuclease
MDGHEVYLVDGTYELFRHFFAVPSRQNADGEEVGATAGVLASVLSLIESGVSHLGVATDHVIESFRNDLWPGYKTGAGVDPRLYAQFPLLEDALAAMGVVVWPMTDLEADDALASAAVLAASEPAVERVVICSPDKDLAQCVSGSRVVRLDRRLGQTLDTDGVVARFGVPPAAIPDYLALVGDSADGFPGLPGWGAKTAASVLARYGHLEAIPAEGAVWDVPVRGALKLAETLVEQRDLALLFRDLATLRTDAPLFASSDALRWRGPTAAFTVTCERLRAPDLPRRAEAAATLATR